MKKEPVDDNGLRQKQTPRPVDRGVVKLLTKVFRYCFLPPPPPPLGAGIASNFVF